VDWQFKVGIAVAVVLGLLPFAVKDMPHWLAWAGILASMLFALWGIPAVSARVPTLPGLLVVASFYGLVAGTFWTISEVPKSDVPGPPEPKAESNPHLALALVIDSLNENEPNFHIEVQNIGDAQVTLTGYTYKTPKLSDWTNLPIDREATIPKEGKISLRGQMLSGITQPPVLLEVTLTYELADAPREIFTSSYKFFVDHAITPPATLLPTDWRETRGGEEQARGASAIFSALSKPSGTVALVLFERKPDGTLNKVTFGGAGKRFVFDPAGRFAEFSNLLSDGKNKTVRGELKPSENGGHSIIITWDNSKESASIMVDGKTSE